MRKPKRIHLQKVDRRFDWQKEGVKETGVVVLHRPYGKAMGPTFPYRINEESHRNYAAWQAGVEHVYFGACDPADPEGGMTLAKLARKVQDAEDSGLMAVFAPPVEPKFDGFDIHYMEQPGLKIDMETHLKWLKMGILFPANWPMISAPETP